MRARARTAATVRVEPPPRCAACWRCAASAFRGMPVAAPARSCGWRCAWSPPKRCRACPRPPRGRAWPARSCRKWRWTPALPPPRRWRWRWTPPRPRSGTGGRLRVKDAGRAAPGGARYRPVRRGQGLDPPRAGGSRLRDGGQPAAAHPGGAGRADGDARRSPPASTPAPAASRPRRPAGVGSSCGCGRTSPATLVFATAEDAMLLRRYSETRRRHPLAPRGAAAAGCPTASPASAR